MAMLIFIIFHLFLEIKSQGFPQAKLTIFPTFAVDEEKVQMICEGQENQHISECMFYPVGQEQFIQPVTSCKLSLTGAELISWSRDQESSHVNISCYYSIGKNETSPHSDRVSVRVRGLATTSSLPPTTEGSPTTTTPNETIQGNSSTEPTSNTALGLAVTSSAEIVTDSITTPFESTTLTDATEHASGTFFLTEGTDFKKYSNTKMFFSIAAVASGAGILLTVLVSICLYGCTRKSKAERIWIEFNSKKNMNVLYQRPVQTHLQKKM
ncbi:uncharacterized protein LOC122353984 isoform X1 [Puntigrus tetrazona]|uniref:uncharacterized protein LOC122353984 isoform X1 n=2 Tax=Puntigrus tetrazona TaxID=1606681 RepID=UPI001C892A0B|nr:uncharacterized protein LOC122353984 isoform X1 [Puntigrus tetrazona]